MRPVLSGQCAGAQPTLASAAPVMNADLMPTPTTVKCREPTSSASLAGAGRRVATASAGLLIALALSAAPAAAQGCGDARAQSVVGLDAIDGDTFRTVDGREWRLAGVTAPKRSDGARTPRQADETPARDVGRPRGSPADAARVALDTLVARQTLWLAEVSDTADRYERRLAVARDAA